MNIAELKYILPSEYDNRAAMIAGLVIVLVSVVFTSLLELKALAVLPALAIIWAALKSRMNLVWVYLSIQPLFFLFSYTIANIYGYILALFLIVTWGARKLLYGFNGKEFSKPLMIIIISYLFLVMVSILPNGPNKNEIYILIRVIIIFLFTIVFYDNFKPKQIYILFFAISIPLLINSIIMIKIFLQQGNIVDFLMLYRLKVGGLFPHPNLAGYFILFGSPFWIALFLWNKNRKLKLISLIVSIFLITSLILTNARASIFGFFVSLFFLALWKKKLKLYIGAVVLVVIIILLIPDLRQLIFLAARIDRGTTTRDVIWLNSLKIIRDNLLFGVGVGNYMKSYDPYLVLAWDVGFIKGIQHAHNFILFKTAELGLMGFFWALALYFLPIKYGVEILRRTKFNDDKAVIYGILATFLGIYAYTMFEAGHIMLFARFYADVPFWILFAAVLKTAESKIDENSAIFGS